MTKMPYFRFRYRKTLGDKLNHLRVVIRNWLLLRLAGSSVIVINAEVSSDGTLVMNVGSELKDCLIYNFKRISKETP